MAPQHRNPDDALTAYRALGVANFVAMHRGTCTLADEPLLAPPACIRALWRDAGLDPARLRVMDIGGTRAL